MALSCPSTMFRSLVDIFTIFHFSMCKKVPKKALFWPFQAFIYTLKIENYITLRIRNETYLMIKMKCLCNEKKYKRSYLYEYVSVKMRKKTPIIYWIFCFPSKARNRRNRVPPVVHGRRLTFSFLKILFRSILHQILKLHSFMILIIYKLCILGIIAVLKMLYTYIYVITQFIS